LAIRAASNDEPVWTQPTLGGDSQITISGASTTVFLEEMRLSGNANSSLPAVDVIGGRVHAQRCAIVLNAGGAINAQDDALVQVETSYVGGSAESATVISIAGSDATILYSTLLSGQGLGARSLSCSNPGTVAVRNSILLGEATADSVSCPQAVFENNGSDQDLGVGNALVVFGSIGLMFDDYPTGDFGLGSPMSQFCLIGVWETGDPATDIDGDLRPTRHGAVDCAGADVP
jgi:hypothetical protein